MPERRLSIYTRPNTGGGVYRVELDGRPVPRVCAVSFACDAEEYEVTASMTFRVDAVDLIEGAALLVEDKPSVVIENCSITTGEEGAST